MRLSLACSLCICVTSTFATEMPKTFPENCIWLVQYGRSASNSEASATDGIIALGLSGDPRHIDLIGNVLVNHENRHLRHQAAQSLYWLNHERCLPYLRQPVNDSYEYTASTAVIAIEALTGEVVVRPEKYSLAQLERKKADLERKLQAVNEMIEDKNAASDPAPDAAE